MVAASTPPDLELVAGSLAERPSRAPVGRIRRKRLLLSAARNGVFGGYFGHRREEKKMVERSDQNGWMAVTRGVFVRIDGGEPYPVGCGSTTVACALVLHFSTLIAYRGASGSLEKKWKEEAWGRK